MSDDALPVETKKPSHLFQKGKSGNPAGRPPGTKNKISLLKLTLEHDLRGLMADDMPEIIAKAVTMAKAGDKEMIKLLYNSWVSKTVAAEDEAPKERISITIGKLDNSLPAVTGKTFTQENE